MIQLPVCLHPKARRVLKLAGWNLLLILAGLLVIGVAGEVYFRLRATPSGDPVPPTTDPIPPIVRGMFMPGVGIIYRPRIEISFTNGLDFRTVQYTNSLGFLDREPINIDDAADSCHITIIGDSFVEAQQVPISEKVQVRLENIAEDEIPELDVTTSAFGFSGTGQVNQIPFYDGYARHLSPDLMILVFVRNDAFDNSTALDSFLWGVDPDSSRYVHVMKNSDGTLELRTSDPDSSDLILSTSSETQLSRIVRVFRYVIKKSYFASWLQLKVSSFRAVPYTDDELRARAEELSQHPEHAWIFAGWEAPFKGYAVNAILDSSSTVYREAWDKTRFALEQFKRRAEHDGVALMILTSYDLGQKGDPMFDILNRIAVSLDIPVVSHQRYILEYGYNQSDAHFPHDAHWSPAGHQWAADAIWEYIKDEWNGECPSTDPDPSVSVDWIKVGHYIHTSESKVWGDAFPVNLDIYRAAYASVTVDLPTVISDWNVHLYREGVTYVKEQCSAEDVESRFFLHLIPKDIEDLPKHRQSNGFHSITFYLDAYGAMFDGRCMASIDLPEYEISSIRTGQVADDAETWVAYYNFALPEILDAVQELQQSGREPVIRSNFNVYIDDGLLVYVKESCDADDRDLPFFLHVFLVDENNLSDGREDSGFANLSFELMEEGGMHDGGCFAAVDMPQYGISGIRTGQIADGVELWSAYYNFALPEILDVVQELLRSGREPDIRSNFDVYMDDGQLVYVKESCSADDRDLPFFLHVFPADDKDLPAGRDEYGFKNLDFELMQRGGELNGDCFAVVGLPAYEIRSIRTGQWVRGEGNVWEASIEFAD